MTPSRFLTLASCYLMAFVSTWLLPLAALAQKKKDDGPPFDQSNWTLAYILVVLAVGLGLMVVCRPGTRQTEIKVQVDDDDDE